MDIKEYPGNREELKTTILTKIMGNILLTAF